MSMNPIHLFDPNMAKNQELLSEVLIGLSKFQKSIPPKFLYDQRGSEIFKKICRINEYYPTRSEMEILSKYSGEIADLMGPNTLLFEPGSGDGEKIQPILEKMIEPVGYVPMEICEEVLVEMTEKLKSNFPELLIHPVLGDFTLNLNLEHVFHGHQGKRVTFFPGSTVGNFTPGEAIELLDRFRRAMGPHGCLIIGVDLKKDPRVLRQAYDDPEGVTAEFNLNLLERLNREAGSNFNPENFYHDALYNEKHGRVEMHLRSRISQLVKVHQTVFRFHEGESIHTENSYKYSTDEFIELGARSGFKIKKYWIDEKGLFCVYFFECPQE
jgi:dimethylhistidine N-methyltransferase